jgi:hypothetical protein
MRFGSFRLVPFVPLFAFLVLGCSGSDGGTDPDPDPVATTVTITSGAINLTEIGQTATIAATVRDQNGQQIPGAPLSFTSGNTAVATVAAGGVVTAAGEGSTPITVRSGAASATVTATVQIASLQAGVPLNGLSASAGDRRIFSFTVPAGLTNAALEVITGAGTGDSDLVINFGANPTVANFDCDSFAPSTSEFCIVPNPQAGEWRIAIDAFTDYSGVGIRARIADLQPVTDGTPITGVGAPAGTFRYFGFDVPTASTSPSAMADGPTREAYDGKERAQAGVLDLAEVFDRAGGVDPEAGPRPTSHLPTLTATTSGGTGDVDLIGTSGSYLSQTSELDCLSIEDGNAEECVTENPSPGLWSFMLLPFVAYDGVTLEIDYDGGDTGGPGQGTITVQKAIQSSSGGPANNPATPSLTGFQFEIRPAGGGSVVATGTTNASGVAQISLDPGSYDVTESNSQGLTDFTTAANGVTVTDGGNTNVAWINRQSAPSGGNGVPVAVIEAGPSSIPAGDGNQTEVRLNGANSTEPDGDPLTYSWSAPGGTFIGSTSAQTARVTFPGGTTRTVSLTVSDGTAQNTAQFQITGTGALPAAGTFNIEIVPVEPITDPDAQAAFDLAEATWESIIRNELPNVNFAGSPIAEDTCITGQPTINDEVDDLRIYVEFAPDDGPGGTLASAGPCIIRTAGTSTTIVGIMSFDSDDFGNLSATSLNRVILHEMAHVLGFGTLWNRNGQLINPSCPDTDTPPDGAGNCSASDPPGPDTRFTGPLASGAYRALGGVANANVPVENAQGGPGTRDGHWRESIFGLELMTGFLTSNVTNPLSLLTVAALDDSGFTVDYSSVDNYSIGGSAPFPVAGDPGVLDLRDDIRTGPIWAIDTDGTLVLVRAGR